MKTCFTPMRVSFRNRILSTCLLAFSLVLLSAFSGGSVMGQATVTTDQPDYAPRSNAVFTGSGFQPGEDVVLKVKNLFRACNTVTSDSSYLPWTVTADANGSFVTNWTVCDCAGDSLRLKATGLTSGLIAYALFSDAANWTLATPTSQACANVPTTFTFTATGSNGTNNMVGCIKVTVPPSFNSISSAFISSTNTSWSLSQTGNIITLSTSNSTQKLAAGENVKFSITGTPTTTTPPGSPFNWVGLASLDNTCPTSPTGQNQYTSPNSTPTVTVNPIVTPSVGIAITGGNNPTCPGTSITFTATPTNGGPTPSYQWKKDGTNVGTGSTYTDPGTGAGDITCVMTSSLLCVSSSTATSNTIAMAISPLPTVFNVSYTGSLCGSPVINLSGSESGVNYTLKRNGSSVETKAGTGGSISFSAVTQTGTYTIDALNTTTTCTSTMNGSVSLGGGTPPSTSFNVTGGGSYCSGGAGLAVGLSGSETGVTYQLYLDGSAIGSSVSGTGAAISFGNKTAAGTYTVVATKTSGNCMATIPGSVTISLYSAPSFSTQPSNQTTTYGDGAVSFIAVANGNPSVTYQWQVNTGSGFSNIPGQMSSTLAIAIPIVSMSGYTYQLVATNTCASIPSSSATLTVIPKTATVVANNKTKTYGDANPALTATVTGEVSGGDAINYSLSTTATTLSGIGDYPIAVNLGSNPNYTVTPTNGTLTVGKRAITITADPKSKIYGDADPALTAQVTTGVIQGTDVASGSLVRAAGENVGSYAISKGTYTYGSNYDETYVGASLTINKRAITITADPKSKIYGDADPALTAQVTTGVIQGTDVASGSLVRAAGENVGSYAISKGTYTYGSNYDETYVGASLTINKRAITITADPKSKIYGDADPALTAQVTTGVIQGTDVASGSLVRAAGENVGSYAISKGTYTYGSNYDETYVGASLTINKRAITITADPQSKIYGDADPALTAQVTTGVIQGTDVASGSLVRAAGENVGSYAISKGTYTYGSNYDETYVGASLTINKRAITITADPQSKIYGDADPALTAQVTTGVIQGTDVASGSLVRAAGENVGSYAISKGTYTYGSNYDETYVGASLTINKRAITITADPKSKIYGDADPALTAQVTTGVIQGTDVASGSLVRAAGENVGSYAISKGTYTYGSNYDETYVGASLTINKRAITITADPKSKIYGDADPALTAQVTTGVIQGTDVASGSLVRAAGENVGSYAISKGTYTYGSNYDETYVGASLTINKRAITITADPKSKIYGDADPALTAQVTTGVIQGTDVASGSLVRAAGENVGSYAISKGTYTYGSNYDETYVGASLTINKRAITITADPQSKIYGDADPALTAQVTTGVIQGTDVASGSLVRAAGENVGSYAISKGTYTYGSNYDETYVGASLTINKRAITITADPKSKIYGDADPALTAQVTTGVIQGTDVASGSLVRAAGENVGSYAISKGTYTYGSNYDETYVGASLTINKRAITITADPKSKIYGDADPALTAQVTTGVIQGTDVASGSLVRAAGENVGSYAISKGTYTYGSNYDETYVGASLTINKRAITITADPKSKIYGDADPALTAQVTTGVIQGTDVASGSLVRAAGENVGSYAISKGTYTYGSNYDETYVGASLTINKRAITITADPKSKIYGDADPALTAQVTTGVIQGTDVASGSLVRAAGENVGSYAISKGTYTYGSNYDETYVGASLTINKRAITITADPKSKIYGDADPALTAQVTTGVIQGTDVASGSLVRAAGENVGSYAISKGTYTYGSNYDETYVGASLTINKRAITITADPKSKIYGDADPALTAQVTTGVIQGTDVASGSLVRAAGENVNSYAISKGTYTYGTNYNETFVGANLVITQKPVIITADPKTKYCGQVDPPLTFASSPVVGTILPNGLAIGFTGSLNRVVGEAIGNYSINQGNVSNANYAITYVGANLTINGLSLDAGESGTTLPINTASTILKVLVTNGPTPIAGVSVKFVVTNNVGGAVTTVGTTATVSTGLDGKASISFSTGSLATGLYAVRAITSTGCSESVLAFFSVYDPSAGFVTGGGWIMSPAGAYRADQNLTGKANFGFNSQYKKGSTSVVEGSTEFQFQTGNLNFKSTNYIPGSLVITGGGKAIYKGSGTINGSGTYNFQVSGIDGSIAGGTDRFRMKIWDNNNNIVYDNNYGADDNGDPSTTLGGGSIVIHQANGKKAAVSVELPVTTTTELKVEAFPTITASSFRLKIESNSPEKINAMVTDINGRTVEMLKVTDGQTTQFGHEYRGGMYLVVVQQGNQRKVVKLVKQ